MKAEPANSTDVSVPKAEVEAAFLQSTRPFQVVTAWVGLGLNLVWCIGDYFLLPEQAFSFLMIRMGVSGTTAFLLLTQPFKTHSIQPILLVLASGISIQNAYMWSVMDAVHFQQHAFAYMVLFVGVGMLVYWNFIFSLGLFAATLISNAVFYALNSSLLLNEFVIKGGLLVFTVAVFSVFLVRTRYRLAINEIRSRLELSKSKKIIEDERNVILFQKKEMTDSITYALRIQSAYLPTQASFFQLFKSAFIVFKPKDIVSGDFFWFYNLPETKSTSAIKWCAVADCTGHGVPGALMSVICCNALNEVLINKKIYETDQILNHTRNLIKQNLKSSGEPGPQDGMDIALIKINTTTRELWYSGAYNPIWIVQDSTLTECKAQKQPVGESPREVPFEVEYRQLNEGAVVYLFSDGFADQFGGPQGKKFKYKALQNLLLSNALKPMAEQGQQLERALESWKGTHEQVDDITLIGIQV